MKSANLSLTIKIHTETNIEARHARLLIISVIWLKKQSEDNALRRELRVTGRKAITENNMVLVKYMKLNVTKVAYSVKTIGLWDLSSSL